MCTMSRRLISHVHHFWRRMYFREIHISNKLYRTNSQTHASVCYHSASNLLRNNITEGADINGRFEEGVCSHLDNDSDNEANVRTIIKYDTSDPIIGKLFLCSTVQDVLNIIDEAKDKLKKEHLVQAVLILWYFQNVFLKMQTQLDSISDITEAEYLKKLQQQLPFQYLVKKFQEVTRDFDIDELTCSLLYLSKMGVGLRTDTMQALIQEIEYKFKQDTANATLTALSRACVALKYNSELWCQFFLLGITPHIEKKLDHISTPEDLRLITICLIHSHHLLSPNVTQKYRKVCETFFLDRVLTENDGKIIVKILMFLSFPFWANLNVGIVRQLGNLLIGHVNQLEIKEVISLNKTFHTHLEPVGFIDEIMECAKRYLTSGSLIPDKDINVGALTVITQLAPYCEKKQMEKLIFRELHSDYFLSTMINIFQMLRCLKTSNQKLIHSYWSKTTEALRTNALERDPAKLLRVGHRYMYFNNNMGGTYRHYGFENQMITWLLEEIEYGAVISCSPSKLARATSFLLAYCKEPSVVISIINHLLLTRSQLNKIDCVVLSRGIEIMLEISRRKKIHPDVMQKLIELDTCLNECAWRHLKDQELSISGINSLLRTFHNRKASPDSLLLHTIIKRLESSQEDLSSRLVRDLSFSLNGLNFLSPLVMDKMARYIAEHEDAVLAETAERVLYTAFYMGYTPTCGNELFKSCARLLIRDKERLSSLNIIQMCLALSFFHAFPPELVSYIFAVDFLERIDDELSGCYGKASYPVRVRFSLMELNRSMCLDLPELDVPWFHAKYCEEVASLDPRVQTMFHEDVGKQLIDVIGGDNFVQTGVYSPYGYKINYLVHLDAMTKPLEKSSISQAKQKVAIILHSENQFTLGDRRLKGQQQLRQRHLEMLGYRVLSIPEFVWNAMYLTEAHAKKTFLSDQIWPER